MEDYKQGFSTFWRTLNEGIPELVSSRWQHRIVTKYREPQRYYHTLQHVLDMKLKKEKYCTELKTPKLVDYAIIFHDVIYNPQSGNNEEESAALFGEFAFEIGMDDTDSHLVKEWILLTKTHATSEHQQENHHVEDKHYFLDLDMAILGSPLDVYSEYAGNIRKEYAHIPHTEYCSRRAKLLENFLLTPRIYASKVFHELYEEQAREHVQQEITQLQQAYSTSK